MKSVILLLFIIGIIMITTGYQQELFNKQKLINNIVEYRFIPNSIYEQQFGKSDLTTSFKDMFNYQDVYIGHTIF